MSQRNMLLTLIAAYDTEKKLHCAEKYLADSSLPIASGLLSCIASHCMAI